MRKIKIARLLDTLRPRNMWDGVKKEQTNKETNKYSSVLLKKLILQAKHVA